MTRINKPFTCSRCVICISCSAHVISAYYVRKGSWAFYLNYPQMNEIRKCDQSSRDCSAAWLPDVHRASFFCVRSSALVVENGRTLQKNLPLSILMSSLPPTGQENVERLSTGTKFAMRQWFKVLHPSSPGSLQRGDSLEGVFQMISKAGHQPVKSPFWGE